MTATEQGRQAFLDGAQLDFGWLDLPVLDEWGYPRHQRGVSRHPGLYVVRHIVDTRRR